MSQPFQSEMTPAADIISVSLESQTGPSALEHVKPLVLNTLSFTASYLLPYSLSGAYLDLICLNIYGGAL